MDQNDALAVHILRAVGGLENVESLTHCVTRLRFQLRDPSLAQTERLKNMDGVLSALQSSGQYMIVLGGRVNDVYHALRRLGCPVSAAQAAETAVKPKKMNPLGIFIDVVTGIFSPMLGLLAGMGILKGLLSLLVAVGLLSAQGGTYNILYSLADSIFYFLPVALGYGAAKKFGLPLGEGMLLGLALVYPNMLEGSGVDVSHLFGIPVSMPLSGDYTGSLMPVIFAVALAVWLRNRIRPRLPEMLRSFLTPLIVLTVTYSLTVLLIGPVSEAAEQLLGLLFGMLAEKSPVFMGFAVGALWQVLVMFGMHWALIPMALANMSTMGYDTILVAMFGTTFAQTGAVIAIYLKSKDARTRRLCPPAILSGLAGVTEPAIYGITLPRKIPYLITCLVSGVAGAVAVGLGARCYVMAGWGVFGYTAYLDIGDVRSMIVMIVLSLASLLAGLVLVALFWREPSKPPAIRQPSPSDDAVLIDSPLAGRLERLENCGDEVFASLAMGNGFAVRPSGRVVTAPFDGVICMAATTGHAVGLEGDNGVDMLIHVGINTVKMEGEGFQLTVEQGQRVRRGQTLLRFDPRAIAAAGYDPVTPVVITNSIDFERFELLHDTGVEIQTGSAVACCHKKAKKRLENNEKEE